MVNREEERDHLQTRAWADCMSKMPKVHPNLTEMERVRTCLRMFKESPHIALGMFSIDHPEEADRLEELGGIQ